MKVSEAYVTYNLSTSTEMLEMSDMLDWQFLSCLSSWSLFIPDVHIHHKSDMNLFLLIFCSEHFFFIIPGDEHG